ncbi:hypothetical protein TNCV_3197671 [Trichonephila clavipes]|nr:hypothetical protein TNCV_3197671 [Trichonephila clavipes]
MVRTSDSRPEGLNSMPPNTLRVHTGNVLVKSGGLKILWAESRVQDTGEYFPSLQFHAKVGEVEKGVVSPSIIPLGNFAELIRSVTCMVLKAKSNDRLTSSPLSRCISWASRSNYVRQVTLATTRHFVF